MERTGRRSHKNLIKSTHLELEEEKIHKSAFFPHISFMPCEFIIFSPFKAQSISMLGISRPFRKGSRVGDGKGENLVFMAAMSMKIYVQQIRRFISIGGYYIHFFNIPI